VTAREGQPLRWVSENELRVLPLLEADWPIVEQLALLLPQASERP
jgi:hypothetical protein